MSKKGKSEEKESTLRHVPSFLNIERTGRYLPFQFDVPFTVRTNIADEKNGKESRKTSTFTLKGSVVVLNEDSSEMDSIRESNTVLRKKVKCLETGGFPRFSLSLIQRELESLEGDVLHLSEKVSKENSEILLSIGVFFLQNMCIFALHSLGIDRGEYRDKVDEYMRKKKVLTKKQNSLRFTAKASISGKRVKTVADFYILLFKNGKNLFARFTNMMKDGQGAKLITCQDLLGLPPSKRAHDVEYFKTAAIGQFRSVMNVKIMENIGGHLEIYEKKSKPILQQIFGRLCDDLCELMNKKFDMAEMKTFSLELLKSIPLMLLKPIRFYLKRAINLVNKKPMKVSEGTAVLKTILKSKLLPREMKFVLNYLVSKKTPKLYLRFLADVLRTHDGNGEPEKIRFCQFFFKLYGTDVMKNDPGTLKDLITLFQMFLELRVPPIDFSLALKEILSVTKKIVCGKPLNSFDGLGVVLALINDRKSTDRVIDTALYHAIKPFLRTIREKDFEESKGFFRMKSSCLDIAESMFKNNNTKVFVAEFLKLFELENIVPWQKRSKIIVNLMIALSGRKRLGVLQKMLEDGHSIEDVSVKVNELFKTGFESFRNIRRLFQMIQRNVKRNEKYNKRLIVESILRICRDLNPKASELQKIAQFLKSALMADESYYDRFVNIFNVMEVLEKNELFSVFLSSLKKFKEYPTFENSLRLVGSLFVHPDTLNDNYGYFERMTSFFDDVREDPSFPKLMKSLTDIGGKIPCSSYLPDMCVIFKELLSHFEKEYSVLKRKNIAIGEKMTSEAQTTEDILLLLLKNEILDNETYELMNSGRGSFNELFNPLKTIHPETKKWNCNISFLSELMTSTLAIVSGPLRKSRASVKSNVLSMFVEIVKSCNPSSDSVSSSIDFMESVTGILAPLQTLFPNKYPPLMKEFSEVYGILRVWFTAKNVLSNPLILWSLMTNLLKILHSDQLLKLLKKEFQTEDESEHTEKDIEGFAKELGHRISALKKKESSQKEALRNSGKSYVLFDGETMKTVGEKSFKMKSEKTEDLDERTLTKEEDEKVLKEKEEITVALDQIDVNIKEFFNSKERLSARFIIEALSVLDDLRLKWIASYDRLCGVSRRVGRKKFKENFQTQTQTMVKCGLFMAIYFSMMEDQIDDNPVWRGLKSAVSKGKRKVTNVLSGLPINRKNRALKRMWKVLGIKSYELEKEHHRVSDFVLPQNDDIGEDVNNLDTENVDYNHVPVFELSHKDQRDIDELLDGRSEVSEPQFDYELSFDTGFSEPEMEASTSKQPTDYDSDISSDEDEDDKEVIQESIRREMKKMATVGMRVRSGGKSRPAGTPTGGGPGRVVFGADTPGGPRVVVGDDDTESTPTGKSYRAKISQAVDSKLIDKMIAKSRFKEDFWKHVEAQDYTVVAAGEESRRTFTADDKKLEKSTFRLLANMKGMNDVGSCIVNLLRQSITSMVGKSQKSHKFEWCFLVDNSGSMNGVRGQIARTTLVFVLQVLHMLEMKFSIIKFGEDPRPKQSLIKGIDDPWSDLEGQHMLESFDFREPTNVVSGLLYASGHSTGDDKTKHKMPGFSDMDSSAPDEVIHRHVILVTDGLFKIEFEKGAMVDLKFNKVFLSIIRILDKEVDIGKENMRHCTNGLYELCKRAKKLGTSKKILTIDDKNQHGMFSHLGKWLIEIVGAMLMTIEELDTDGVVERSDKLGKLGIRASPGEMTNFKAITLDDLVQRARKKSGGKYDGGIEDFFDCSPFDSQYPNYDECDQMRKEFREKGSSKGLSYDRLCDDRHKAMVKLLLDQNRVGPVDMGVKEQANRWWLRFKSMFSRDIEVLGETLSGTLFPTNKFTRMKPTVRGSQLYIPGYIRYIITCYSDRKFWQKKIHGGKRDYQVVFLLDKSTSMNRQLFVDNFLGMLLMIESLTSIDISKFAVLTFGASVRQIKTFDDDFSDLNCLSRVLDIMNHPYEHETKDAEAIEFSTAMFDTTSSSSKTRKIMFVLTDGNGCQGLVHSQSLINAGYNHKVRVIGITFGAQFSNTSVQDVYKDYILSVSLKKFPEALLFWHMGNKIPRSVEQLKDKMNHYLKNVGAKSQDAKDSFAKAMDAWKEFEEIINYSQKELETERERSVNVTRERSGGGRNTIDLCFVMDCTGSMSSAIAGAKRHIQKVYSYITDRIKEDVGIEMDVKVSFVGYRDWSDSPRNVIADFEDSANSGRVFSVVNAQSASGGADCPEELIGGLLAASKLKWRERSHKIICLIADAPCHGRNLGYHTYRDDYPNGNSSMPPPEQMLRTLTEAGIRIIFTELGSGTRTMISKFNEHIKAINEKFEIEVIKCGTDSSSMDDLFKNKLVDTITLKIICL